MTRLLAAWALALPLTGCLLAEGGDDACDDDEDNDADGRVDCADPGCDLAAVCSPCGDGALDDAEACDDGNTKDDDGCSSRCMKEGCGNGTLDAGEECDDGNVIAADGCNFRCEVDRCGDGLLNATGEVCDDGNIFSGDGCSRFCRAEPEVTCGNGRFDPEEQCEDGNRRDGDGCNHRCQGEFCGDGVVQPALGEQCEGVTAPDGSLCQSCRVFLCGNGNVDAFEQCDDGNTFDGDGCTSFCTVERCGDFIQQAGEQCDDGNTVSGDFCSATCRSERCGDGIVQARLGELCDGGESCSISCVPLSSCATRPEGGALCFGVEVRNASFAARTLARVRLPSDTWLESASVQAGFVDRFDPSPLSGPTQPPYSRSPILLTSVDINGDGVDETLTAGFDNTAALHQLTDTTVFERAAFSLTRDGTFVFPIDLRAAAVFSEAPTAMLSLAQTGSLLVADLSLDGGSVVEWISVPPDALRVAGAPTGDNEGVVWVAAGSALHPIRATHDDTADGVELTADDPIAIGAAIGDLAVATLDGAPTLLVLTRAPDQLLAFVIGADGALDTAPVTLADTPGADLLSVGDVDDDLALDFVTANASHTLTIHLAADGFLASSTLPAPSTPTRPVIADLDADGVTDLAAAGGFFTPHLVLYRGEP